MTPLVDSVARLNEVHRVWRKDSHVAAVDVEWLLSIALRAADRDLAVAAGKVAS